MNRMAPLDAAYLAGLIDGDGTVTLTRKHKNETRHASVSISNTDRTVLEFVLRIVGAGKITRKTRSQVQHAPSYAYAIYNRQALGLIDAVMPFLRTYKAQRARLILDRYLAVTPRNGKYSPALRSARKAFERDVLGILPAENPPEPEAWPTKKAH